MLGKVLSLYKRLKRRKHFKSITPYVSLNQGSFYGDSFKVDLRNPLSGRVYLKTGNQSILEGKYIFETETGKIDIGDRVHIGNSTFISRDSIIIEDDVTIAWDCLFYDHNSHSVNWDERKNDTIQEYKDFKAGLSMIANKDWSVVKSAPIHVCSKVWIGTGCKILKGVTIGEGAVVGAGSIVTKDVEPWTVVAGNPARIVKKLK